jgi:hypothetical protein
MTLPFLILERFPYSVQEVGKNPQLGKQLISGSHGGEYEAESSGM